MSNPKANDGQNWRSAFSGPGTVRTVHSKATCRVFKRCGTTYAATGYSFAPGRNTFPATKNKEMLTTDVTRQPRRTEPGARRLYENITSTITVYLHMEKRRVCVGFKDERIVSFHFPVAWLGGDTPTSSLLKFISV